MVTSSVTVYMIFFYRSDIKLGEQNISLEYGETFDIDPKTALKTESQSIIDTINLDTSSIHYADDKNYPSVGEYIIKVNYTQKGKSQTKETTLKVVDTTPPEFVDFQEAAMEIQKGDENPDYSTYFKAKDLSEFEIVVDDNKVDYQTEGDYEIEVTAKDVYDNATTMKSNVKIVTQPVATSNGATYVDGILIVNKKHGLPSSYAPGENYAAGQAVRRLIADMQSAGLDISNSYSGYRNYSYQAQLYQSYVNSHGQAAADTFSARPGYSEHQAGLAFDILHSNGRLVTTGAEANWLASNAHNYGFIIRYQSGKESITGYNAEPWHLRYIGDQATTIYQSGLVLEEYLGVSGGDYN